MSDRKLHDFIRELIKKEKQDDQIVKNLSSLGYNAEEIKKAIKKIREKKNIFSRMIRIEKKEKEEKKKVGITSRLDELNERLDGIATVKKGKSKDKAFELSWWQKSQLKSLAMKQKLLILYLKENRAIKPVIAPIKDNFVIIEGKAHNISMDYIFLWRGKYPAIVLPEWDINPIGTKDYYDASIEGRKSNAAATITRMIVNAEKLNKPQIGGKALIGIIIGSIIVAYLIFGGGI